jgi:pimeloyl-ACP methyl ester carboxylesterase
MAGSTRPPLLMIHGAFCGAWAFNDFRSPFEHRYKVYAPTLRYHDCGRDAPKELGRTSLLDYAADLEKLIAGLDDKPVLVGHSMGGLLAQMLAARGLARACVLLAPSAPWGVLPSTMFEIASAQALLFSGGDYRGSAIPPSYQIAAAHSLDKLDASARRAVYARFVPESGQATFEIMNWSFDFRRASYVRARGVTCPVLCLVGSGDKISPPSTVGRIALRYQGRAHLEVLKDHSHWLIGEPGWERVAARAVEWLDRALLGKQRAGAENIE